MLPHTRRLACRALLPSVLLLAPAFSPTAGETLELDGWWTVGSESFVVYTNAEPERGVEVALHLELFRRAFARLAPGIELRNPTPTKIVAFRDRETYAPYKPWRERGGRGLLGTFLRHPDGNFLTLDAGSRLAGAFAVIYHEMVHYLVDHNFPGVPRWLNEGLAEYYSTFAVDGDEVFLGRPVERHLRWLRADNRERETRFLSHDFSLEQVLTGEADHRRKVGGFYAFSWALTHYLLSGEAERLDHTADFLVRLRHGEDPEAAFERAYGVRLAEMEETLRSYAHASPSGVPGSSFASGDSAEPFPVSALRVEELGREVPIALEALPPREVLFHLGDLLTRMGRLEAAELHFHEALELDPRHPEAHAGLALVRDHESRSAEAAVLYRDALRLGSEDPLTYLRYGRHLLARLAPEAGVDLVRRGEPGAVVAELASTSELVTPEPLRSAAELAAARRAFARAVELDPHFAHARLLVGVSHLFGDADPAPGIAALEKLRQWLPFDDGAAFSLLQLHLKDGDFERAERLFEEAFHDHPDLELARRAEEELERARLLHRASAAFENGDTEEGLRLFDQAIAVTTDQALRDRLSARLAALEAR